MVLEAAAAAVRRVIKCNTLNKKSAWHTEIVCAAVVRVWRVVGGQPLTWLVHYWARHAATAVAQSPACVRTPVCDTMHICYVRAHVVWGHTWVISEQ